MQETHMQVTPLQAQFRTVHLFVQLADLDLSSNLRADIYTYLMQQPEFVNPVADMNDDFPVTSV